MNVRVQQKNTGSVWHAIRRMIAIRKQHQAFGRGSFDWIDAGTNCIAAYTRNYENETIFVFHNLSEQPQTAHLSFQNDAINAFTGETVSLQSITLEPLQYLWLVSK